MSCKILPGSQGDVWKRCLSIMKQQDNHIHASLLVAAWENAVFWKDLMKWNESNTKASELLFQLGYRLILFVVISFSQCYKCLIPWWYLVLISQIFSLVFKMCPLVLRGTSKDRIYRPVYQIQSPKSNLHRHVHLYKVIIFPLVSFAVVVLHSKAFVDYLCSVGSKSAMTCKVTNMVLIS